MEMGEEEAKRVVQEVIMIFHVLYSSLVVAEIVFSYVYGMLLLVIGILETVGVEVI